MSLWLPEIRWHRSLPTALVAGLLFSGAAAVVPAATPASAAEAELSPLTERYRVEVGDDGIELTPMASDSAVSSIELLDDEDEALVNGKAFTRQELEAFLGEDGRALAAVLDLSSAERRAALGFREEGAEEEEPHGAVPHAPEPPSAPGVPPPPVPHFQIEADGDDRVSVGQWIHIEAGQSTGDAVCIGCSIVVEGEVEGDAVAVGGRVEVRSGGSVDGNVVSVGRRVDVASGATIEGDAVAVGGKVYVEEGGSVEGQRSSVGWGSAWFGGPTTGMMPIDFSGSFSDVFWSVLRTLLMMLVAAIVVLFLRGSVERTSRRVVEEPWRAIFAGILTQLLFFPVLILATVILAVSIIGIPLLVLVPVAILAFFVAMIVGFVSVAQSLGRWGRERFGWHLSEPFLVVLVGVALIQTISIVGHFFGLFGMVGGILGFTLLCLGFFLKYVAWTMGLGGMVLSTLARDWKRPAPGMGVPPTPPPVPPLSPIDFTRDDRDLDEARALEASAPEEAARMAPPAEPPAGYRADEATESVREDEIRDRNG